MDEAWRNCGLEIRIPNSQSESLKNHKKPSQRDENSAANVNLARTSQVDSGRRGARTHSAAG